jgi:hypothetical protein
MASKNIRKKTRPPQTTLNRLRTVLWYSAVKEALGLPSAYRIEQLLDSDKFVQVEGETRRNSKWDRYSRGQRVPNIKPDSSIERAELQAPGTSRWFLSPIWSVLQGRPMKRHEVEAYLENSPAILAVIFPQKSNWKFPKNSDDISEKDHAQFPGRSIVLDNVPSCVNLEGIDLLEATVLLLAAGVDSGSEKLTKAARDLYVSATPKIEEIITISNYFPEFFDAVEHHFAKNADTDWNDDFVPPWFVRLPDLFENQEHIQEHLRRIELDRMADHSNSSVSN